MTECGRFPGIGRLRTGWRGVAVALLTLALAACAGGSPKVSRDVEPSASSQNVASLVRLADGLRAQGELGTAIALYQRAAANSDDPSDLVRLGRALAEAGATERAVGAFREALSRAPGHPDALLGLGTTSLVLGRVDQSIRYLDELVDGGDGSDTVAYAALGAALDIAGRHERAVAVYQTGLRAVPGDLDLTSNLALSYALHGRAAEAIDLMIGVTDSLDARRSHHRNLVLVLALAGQNREAVAAGLRRLGERETQDVLAQALSVRRLPLGADRARAIGLS